MGNKPIVHAPIATGSTEPRDIRDRFADFVNLKDFGAVGDGLTDDSSAWAAWQTALQNGGTPYIPKGDYVLGEEIIHAPKGHLGGNPNTFTYEDDGNVIDEFSAIIYVDATNGNDSNSGLTSATAVKTINKAVELGTAKLSSKAVLNIAGGTYTEDFAFSRIHLQINLLGDVTLSGSITLINYSCIYINNSNYTFTASSTTGSYYPFQLYDHSAFMSHSNVVINSANSGVPLLCQHYSSVIIGSNKSLAITANNTTDTTVQFYNYSYFLCTGDFSITGSGNAFGGVNTNYHSLTEIDGTATIGSDTFMNDGVVVRCGRHSRTIFNGNTTIYCCPGSNYGIYISDHANLTFAGNSTNLYYNNSSRRVAFITALRHSILELSSANLLMSSSGTLGGFLYIQYHSSCVFEDNSKVKFAGKVDYTGVLVTIGSDLEIPSSVTFTNNLTGRRYTIGQHSYVATHGGGANKLPGNSAGYTNTAQYGIYD